MAMGALILFALSGKAFAAQDLPSFVQDGHAGFVVSDIAFALSKDYKETGACPNGLTKGYSGRGGAFLNNANLERKEGEKDQDYFRRVFGTAMSDPNIKNLCQNPELGKPDPNFQTVTGKNVPVEGIDLDGQVSTADGTPAPGTCAHDDFVGMDGTPGVDNQFFRAVGCSQSYQPNGSSVGFSTEMLTGAWGILITLDGVDDIKNDDDVEVGFYANADPIQLSPNREPLENATYAMDQDPRFRAKTHGRIVNGVLTTDPVDVRFHKITNSIYLERPLDHARVRMTLSDDGILEGYLAGYTNVEDLYDFQFGFRNGKDANGDPAPLQLRNISSIGAAGVLTYTCQGAYYALKAAADGDPDPETGKCTSVSMQYRIKAIPAFVVDEATQSSNEQLEETSSFNSGGGVNTYNNNGAGDKKE